MAYGSDEVGSSNYLNMRMHSSQIFEVARNLTHTETSHRRNIALFQVTFLSEFGSPRSPGLFFEQSDLLAR